MGQKLYSIRDDFRWVADSNDSWWYEIDIKKAESNALRARNREAKRLKDLGHEVTIFSLGRQLLSFGGIGTGMPHIELVGKTYGLNFTEKNPQ